MYPEHDRVIREVFGEGFPAAEQMEKNVSLLMHCASSSVYWPQSLTPNVVKVGATHVDEPKPLPAVSTAGHGTARRINLSKTLKQ